MRRLFYYIISSFSVRQRVLFYAATGIFVVSGLAYAVFYISKHSVFIPVEGGVFREGATGQPVRVNPLYPASQVDEDLVALLFSPLSDMLSAHEERESGKVHVLKLKENLMWDDGQPLRSDDLIFTIQLTLNSDTQSSWRSLWQGIEVERESELQVKLTLPDANVFFAERLKRFYLVPQHVFGAVEPNNIRLSGYNIEPVGNGPYKFQALRQRRDGFITHYELVRNENYQGTSPFIPTFIFIFYENEEYLKQAFRLGEVDSLLLVPASYDGARNFFTEQELISFPASRYYGVFLNDEHYPSFQDINLRKALDLAVDRLQLTKNSQLELAIPLITLRMPMTDRVLDSFSSSSLKYDLDEARRLFELSKESPVVFDLLVPRITFLQETAEKLRTMWLALGVAEVNIKSVDADLFEKALATREYDAVLFGSVLESPFDIYPFWHSSQNEKGGLNFAGYENTRTDIILEKIRSTSSEEEQRFLFDEAVRMIQDDAPYVMLYTLPYYYAVRSTITGVKNASSSMYFSVASDRFEWVERWHTEKVRVLR